MGLAYQKVEERMLQIAGIARLVGFYLILLLVAWFLLPAVVRFLQPFVARGASRLIDRHKLRPSIFQAVIALVPSLWILLSLWLMIDKIPPWFYILCVGSFSLSAGYTIETLRRPPPIEFRPNWYSGDGDPSWLTWSPGMTHPYLQQLTLSWLFTSLTVFCCFLGFQSNSLAQKIQEGRQHRRANVALKKFGINPSERNLKLAETKLSKADIETILQHCKSLVIVDLRKSDIDNETMRLLARHTELRTLIVMDTPITDVGLGHLAQNTQLASLLIGGTDVTGSGLGDFESGQFRSLGMERCPITHEGLRQVARLSPPNLAIDQTKVTKHLVEADLSLAAIPALARWSVRAAPATSNGK